MGWTQLEGRWGLFSATVACAEGVTSLVHKQSPLYLGLAHFYLLKKAGQRVYSHFELTIAIFQQPCLLSCKAL